MALALTAKYKLGVLHVCTSSWVGQPHASQRKHQGIPATCCLHQVPGITRAEEAASSSSEINRDFGHMQKPANLEGQGQVLKYTCGSPLGVLFSAALDRGYLRSPLGPRIFTQLKA